MNGPSAEVCQDLIANVYTAILQRAGVVPGAALDAAATQAGYSAVNRELDSIRVNIGHGDDTLSVALTNYFGYRPFTNLAGVGATFTRTYPTAESDLVYAFMQTVPAADRKYCLAIGRTATHHVLSVISTDPAISFYHMTVPRNPIGLNERDPWKNFTIHYNDERTRVYTYHRFNLPRGPRLAAGEIDPVITAAVQLEVAAAQAIAAAAAAAVAELGDPASIAIAARAARPPPAAAAPAPAPPAPPAVAPWRPKRTREAKLGGRRTLRSRRTRRR